MSNVHHHRPVVGGLRLASRTRTLVPSAVREILKVTERPEVISLAGGLPAPELFPVAEVATAFQDALAWEGRGALQYGVTEGWRPLREWIAARLRTQGIAGARAEDVLVTTGAQQGIDLLSKVLLDAGDRVLVEAPTYLAALQVFDGYEARPVAAPGDDEGLCVDANLAALLARHHPSMLYLVPEFQNPKGTSLAPERRAGLVAMASAHRVPILEDDPYGELRFEGELRRPLAAQPGAEGWVVRLGTFSKTLAPGLRVGWAYAPGELGRRMVVAKQAADLHSSTLVQRATALLLQRFDYDGHLARIRAVYRARRDAMLHALEQHMPEGTTWTRPEGGLFLWLTLPPGVSDRALFEAGVAQDVAVVPGSAFFAGGAEHGFVRLNFSNQSEERILEGVRRLGVALEQLCREARPPLPLGEGRGEGPRAVL